MTRCNRTVGKIDSGVHKHCIYPYGHEGYCRETYTCRNPWDACDAPNDWIGTHSGGITAAADAVVEWLPRGTPHDDREIAKAAVEAYLSIRGWTAGDEGK